MPERVEGLRRVVALAVGDRHSLALQWWSNPWEDRQLQAVQALLPQRLPAFLLGVPFGGGGGGLTARFALQGGATTNKEQRAAGKQQAADELEVGCREWPEEAGRGGRGQCRQSRPRGRGRFRRFVSSDKAAFSTGVWAPL